MIPNPAQQYIEVSGLKKDDRLIISDMLGRVVMNVNAPQTQNKFDIRKLARAAYQLKVYNAQRIQANIKFIKE